jgi:hypothetical protein
MANQEGQSTEGIEWVQPSRAVMCQWPSDPCSQEAGAKITRDGVVTRDLCDDHAIEHHLETGAKFVNEWQPAKRRTLVVTFRMALVLSAYKKHPSRS